MRVHILAKELNVSSKIVLEKCRAEGLGDVVKNHMSALGAGLEATIREWFSEGTHSTAVETAERIDLDKVRVARAEDEPSPVGDEADAIGAALAQATSTAVVDEPIEEIPASTEAAPPPPVSEAAREPAPAPVQEAAPAGAPAPAVATTEAPPQITMDEDGGQPDVAEPPRPEPAESTAVAAEAPQPAPDAPEPPPIKPAGPQNIPVPARISGPRVVRYEAPDYDAARLRPRSHPGGGPAPSVTTEPHRETVRKPGKDDASKRPRGRRIVLHDTESTEKLLEWRDQDLAERRARLRGATGRRIHRRRSDSGGVSAPAAPKTTATVSEPITVREFCNATGINQIRVYASLRREHDMLANINTTLAPEIAQLLALEFGIELEVVPAKTALDLVEDEFANRQRADERPRPPIVTMMGHVDHGKTSLLDYIRKTRVVAGEDGGITQHISSYHYRRGDVAVTFLDTPGHEAFTAMRARGAHLTDVVVLVVAADDGVMPQTVEAMNHAKAANTPIVVALNKIDLGRENEMRIYGQLAEHDLAPAAWGGHTEVIPTSAVTGEGVDALLETLTTLSELLELKADPTVAARGIVIEAETKQGVGSVASAIVQEGTLRVGDVVVCGNACGKVRALLDDRGKRIKEAGPAIPVEIWGLSDVPQAGDRFYQVDSLQRASLIASEVKAARLTESRSGTQKIMSLEEMLKHRDAGEIPELNVIIKADVQGSVDALRHMLDELPSDQVRLVIRHAGVGAVTDSDVLLAAASKAIIIGFRVQAGTGSRRVAEEHGVDVRNYLVVYDVVNDIRKALEGLLAPEERIEARGTAEVREVFKVSKVGKVAGCFVREGPIQRNHFAKVLRDGVVIRTRTPIASLRHFKDDVKEVRAGLECGIMLADFSDIHVGDVIETFEVVKVARTLE